MVLAITYRYSGDLEGSRREYEKTLERNARLAYAISGLAAVHLDRGEPAMAREVLSRARPEDRSNYVIRLTWALLLAGEGRAEAARREADPAPATGAGRDEQGRLTARFVGAKWAV
jgi:Flp pilus assembly protein TadD